MYSKDCEPINNLLKANSIKPVWNGNNCCDMKWGPSIPTRKRSLSNEYSTSDNVTTTTTEDLTSTTMDMAMVKRNEEIVNYVECKVLRNEAKVVSIKFEAYDNCQIKSDTFPNEFGQLSELKTLWLSKHKIKQLSPTIGQMTKLEQLVLINNGISGEIPPEIGNLNQLIGLNLSGNKLKGSIPETISNLTLLNTLQLYSNQLEGAIPDLMLTLPLKTCNLDDNHALCLSDRAQYWNSECKNNVSDLCSDLGHGGIGKLGVVLLIIMILFIGLLILLCTLYYRRNGDLKWSFIYGKYPFKKNYDPYSYDNYSYHHKSQDSLKNKDRFSYYLPSTKYNRSPKKTNYAEDLPVQPYDSYTSKYYPSFHQI